MGRFFAGFQYQIAGIFLLSNHSAASSHSHKVLFRKRVRLHGFDILIKCSDHLCSLINLLGERLQNLILQTVLFGQVIRLHQPQTGNIHIQIHLFLYARISGAQSLDFRIGKSSLVNILTGTDGTFA